MKTATTDTGASPAEGAFLQQLTQVIEQRRQADPASSYTARLLHAGLDAILKKLGEESAELIMAAKDGQPANVVHETADLWFHTLILLAHHDLTAADVIEELERRRSSPPA